MRGVKRHAKIGLESLQLNCAIVVACSTMKRGCSSYCATTMFIRFRQTPKRLQISLVETRRVDGKVRHQHVAALGSIAVPWSVADRVSFWAALHQRLGRLSNRIIADDLHKLMAAIHERVPMVLPDEQRQVQVENAEHDLAVWSGLRYMNAGTPADHKGLAAKVTKKIADLEASTIDAAARSEAAKERLTRIKNGEDVSGGLGRPKSFDEILRDAGFTEADFRHWRVLGSMSDATSKEYLAAIGPNERRERAIARAVLRKHRAP